MRKLQKLQGNHEMKSLDCGGAIECMTDFTFVVLVIGTTTAVYRNNEHWIPGFIVE